MTTSTPFKYKGKIDYSIRESRLSKRIINYFIEKRNEKFSCFGEILDKYCKVGMSKLYVKKIIEKLTCETIKIQPNTIDEAIKSEMAKGRTKFYFHARTKNNPFHLNRGLKRKYKYLNYNQETNFVCLECKYSFIKNIHITIDGFIGLRKRNCPKCGKKSTLVASFSFKNDTVYKAIIDKKEKFVISEKNKLIQIN
jgi:rubrerythrin